MTFGAEPVRGIDDDIVEEELAGGGRANAHFVLLFSDFEPRGAATHDEGGDALVLLRKVDGREDDEELRLCGVGNPHFGAVEDVLAAVRGRLRGGAQRERVASARRLAETKRRDPALGHAGQPALLLLVGRVPAHGLTGERVVNIDDDGDRRIMRRDGLHGEHGARKAEPRRVLVEALRRLDGHDARGKQRRQKFGRENAGAVGLQRGGAHVLGAELVDGVDEHCLILGESGGGAGFGMRGCRAGETAGERNRRARGRAGDEKSGGEAEGAEARHGGAGVVKSTG
mmetsp:Transcript_2919/g.7629  ORF Transcript_2919/g.7629 Transcript_2919/m.7629 type:complete len:285 (+) Transcript_2919:532-1386(+)